MKKDFYFNTFEQIAENIKEATDYFSVIQNPVEDLAEFAQVMKQYESKGDQYTHAIITALNKTYVTPIEREDILLLATKLDDILDGIEACASRIETYQLREPDSFLTLFVDNLNKLVAEIVGAFTLLKKKKMLAIREHTIQINVLENEADDLLRESIRWVFSNITDPIHLIKKKEIYEMLEETSDHCEDVANILESIIMRS